MADNITFYDSDAWVLLSVIYAHRAGTATLDKIIGAGDAIIHAIFLPHELAGGLARTQYHIPDSLKQLTTTRSTSIATQLAVARKRDGS